MIGEDASSIERHVQVLHMQYEKMTPDASVVNDRMQRTFAWRRKEIADGMAVEDVLKKYPFLRTPTGVNDLNDSLLSIFLRGNISNYTGLIALFTKKLNNRDGKDIFSVHISRSIYSGWLSSH